jgi:hypothetical protein
VIAAAAPTESRKSRAAADAARVRRSARLGRALPAVRDPQLGGVAVTAELVDQVTAIIDADPDLCDWIEDLIVANYIRPGRPREFSIRTALILFAVQVIVNKNFHAISLEALLAGMPESARIELGIDYTHAGDVKQISYTQLLDCFHAIARTMDAWDDTLIDHPDETELRQQRAGHLQDFVERLVTASTHAAGPGSGNYAADATMKWSWERPPASGGSKIGRRGNDGEAGNAAPLAEVLDGHKTVDTQPSKVVRRTKRKTGWPSTWSLGAEWAGRPNAVKAVHGYAFHSVVRSGELEPALIDTFVLTPAVAHPAQSLTPIIERLAARRTADPALPAGVPALGYLSADPGYSAATIDDWQLRLKDLGAKPVYRLHRTNQEPPSWVTVGKGKRRGNVLFVGGRPMCECATHIDAINDRFPKWPFTAADLEAHQSRIKPLERFEWAPNGAVKADGSRRFVAPHRTGPDGKTGGCPHCVTKAGAAVKIDGKPLARCCQTRTRTFDRRQLAMHQEETVGSPEWCALWNRRSIVEGSYGIMKNRAVLDWGRDFHHFVGLARETIVAAFAAVAYNVHMLRSHAALMRLRAEPAAVDPFAPERLTATVPPAARPTVDKEPKGPKGLEFLARPPGPPG